VLLGLIRDGRRLELPVQVGTLDEDDPEQVTRLLGVVLRGLEPAEARRAGISQGLLVTAVEPGSLGERAGLVPGSLILEANRQPLGSTRELARILADADGSVLLRIADNGRSRYVTLRWR
jgi:serine protease Do